MTLQHEPQDRIEKVFIMFYTMLTYDLSEYVYIIYAKVVDQIIYDIIGEKDLIKGKYNLTNKFWMFVLFLNILVYAVFLAILSDRRF